MTERKLYRCDICGTEYANPKDAQQCEAYHIFPAKGVKQIKSFFKSMNQTSCDEYPYKVVITMNDGKQIQYTR